MQGIIFSKHEPICVTGGIDPKEFTAVHAIFKPPAYKVQFMKQTQKKVWKKFKRKTNFFAILS